MSGIPDLAYIKRQISIAAVASALGLEVCGYMARCWRPEAHQHGDRSPSVSFSKKKNVGKCFVCDDRAWSNIDLVTMIRSCSVREAIQWIAVRWTVPTIAKKHLTNRRTVSAARVGCGSRLEQIIRSGLWAQLSAPEKSILVVFSELDAAALRISYAGIARFAGVGSFSTIACALKRFESMGLLQVHREPAGDGLRACNKYALTLDSPTLNAVMTDIHGTTMRELEAEKEIRQAAHVLKSRSTSLHSGCSDVRFPTTPKVEQQIKKVAKITIPYYTQSVVANRNRDNSKGNNSFDALQLETA